MELISDRDCVTDHRMADLKLVLLWNLGLEIKPGVFPASSLREREEFFDHSRMPCGRRRATGRVAAKSASATEGSITRTGKGRRAEAV
jgi:hypothetical protein